MLRFHRSFIESLPGFLSSLPNTGYNVKELISLIPKDCIVTISDKNVGISLLPPDWYFQEYMSQISKGGHQKIEIGEQECIRMLCNEIDNFKESCSSLQSNLVKSLWPKEPFKNHRIGVMKLIPKVHKLKGKITPDSWKKLPSRPIRGAEIGPYSFPF